MLTPWILWVSRLWQIFTTLALSKVSRARLHRSGNWAGAVGKLSIECSAQGSQCLRLHSGWIAQRVDVSALAGQRVELSLLQRTAADAKGELSVAIRGPDGDLWWDYLPVQADSWEPAQLLIDVPQAASLELLLRVELLHGEHLDLDHVRLSPLGTSQATAAALAPEAAQRLAAFTEALCSQSVVSPCRPGARCRLGQHCGGRGWPGRACGRP